MAAAATPSDAPRVRSETALLLGLAAVALALRLGPLLVRGQLRDVLGYDDGVYFAGAQALLGGAMPY